MIKSLDHILFATQQMTVGLFDCPVSLPNFSNTGPIQGYLLAFPRTAVRIRHLDMPESFVADPNIVTIYNRGQEYERYSLSPYGDRCDWLSISSELVRETLLDIGAYRIDDTERLFSFSHSVTTPEIYRSFRQLIEYLKCCKLNSDKKMDSLIVEETILGIFRSVIKGAYSNWGVKTRKKRRATTLRHQQLVDQTQEYLALNFSQPLSLEFLSKKMNCSAYHLSRIFSRLTHQSIHQYLNQLRLREALNRMSGNTDLADLGIDLGFSDHSHFSQSFRKSFAVTPSYYRKQLSD